MTGATVPETDIVDTDNHEDAVDQYPKIYGVPMGVDGYALGAKALERFVCHVCLDDNRLYALKEYLKFFYPELTVLTYPAWDCLPYDRVSPSGDAMGDRIEALMGLLSPRLEKTILLTSLNAITQRTTPKSFLKTGTFSCKKGDFINPEKLSKFLVQNGFNKTETVREQGEFAVRGGIMDIFPASEDQPLRLDLFGNEVETIRYFDPLDQRTTGDADHLSLGPTNEVFLNEDTIANFKKNYRELFGVMRGDDPLFEAISEGRKQAGMEHWLPLFYEQTETLFDYMPKDSMLTLDYQFASANIARAEQVQDFYQSRQLQAKIEEDSGDRVSYHPIMPASLFLPIKEWRECLDGLDVFELSTFGNPSEQGGEDFRGKPTQKFAEKDNQYDALKQYIQTLQEDKKKVLIACYSEGARARLQSILAENGIENTQELSGWHDVQSMSRGKVGLCLLRLEDGFTLDDFVILTEQDILGDRLMRPVRKKKDSENFIQEVSSLKTGDLVVHIEHGIGRFLSLETIEVMKIAHDCIKIEYAGGDKLYIPVENIETISRYGSEDSGAQLDKLGGAGWQARKARAKKDLLAIAGQLLEVAAARELKKADSLEVSEGMYQEFAARFPYTETEDQLTSINAVIEDLNKGRPMDRLVCGDVGFGKTEVALRGAFVAAMAGSQVAIVAPTTLLCRQHYIEFKRRFAGLPIRIEQLSRLVKPSQATKTKKALSEGQVDIVIGTHSILAESIRFKNLGLLIVDEEQRFGVKQKERLKQLKENVHILTLTATPIPRTLQLALTGVRDLSLITTPPVDRLAVRTFVLPYDPIVIREALMREHYRGGQSFYVCPRISDMADLEKKLKKLVPELKIIKAHGQMPAETLEDRMGAFCDGQYDVLLATNIIESGIDISNANTMIVHRPELFGLAQLYQIRGRIGRSKVRGYAYLTHDPRKPLTKQAVERLKVLETLDTLGAGFQISSHDMDIRGAGNLLGEEQSGHIRDIGVELYQQMLEEAIEEAKTGTSSEDIASHWTPQINLGTNVLIPKEYIPDLNVRLSMYRRIADLVDREEIDSFAAEMIDRFGALPDEVKNLFDVIAIKQLCKKAGVEKVEAGPKGAILSFRNNQFKAVDKLVSYVTKQAGSVRMRPDQKLVFIRAWPKQDDRVKGVTAFIQDLIDLLI